MPSPPSIVSAPAPPSRVSSPSPPFKVIVIVTAKQHVIAGAACQGVLAAAAVNPVVAFTTPDTVVVVVAVQGVVGVAVVENNVSFRQAVYGDIKCDLVSAARQINNIIIVCVCSYIGKAAVGGQVDLITFTGVEVRNGVCTVAGGKFEGVSVIAAGQPVVAAPANQRVVSSDPPSRVSLPPRPSMTLSFPSPVSSSYISLVLPELTLEPIMFSMSVSVSPLA